MDGINAIAIIYFCLYGVLASLVCFLRICLTSDGAIQIKGLASAYSPSEPIEVSIAVLDESYDCGDLYITIEDSTGKTVSQNGYFKECFVDDGANLPTSETYSEKTDQRGKYTIEAKIYDRDRINSIHVKETFYIR